jgi:hypothetical protein
LDDLVYKVGWIKTSLFSYFNGNGFKKTFLRMTTRGQRNEKLAPKPTSKNKTRKKSKTLKVKKTAAVKESIVVKTDEKKRSNSVLIAVVFLIVLAVIILLLRNCRGNNPSALPQPTAVPQVVSQPTISNTTAQKKKTGTPSGGIKSAFKAPVTTASAQTLNDYQKAAAQGDVQAAKNLANLYMNGQGVPKDYHEALKWSLMAANKGDAEAQCCVGLIYDMALGVPQDYKEAMSWYLKSANQGNAVAENCIGFCYENGHGVPQSYDDAASWFEKSALQGNANAVQNLESMKDLMPSSSSDTTPGTN